MSDYTMDRLQAEIDAMFGPGPQSITDDPGSKAMRDNSPIDPVDFVQRTVPFATFHETIHQPSAMGPTRLIKDILDRPFLRMAYRGPPDPFFNGIARLQRERLEQLARDTKDKEKKKRRR